jgi:hypothetical protein
MGLTDAERKAKEKAEAKAKKKEEIGVEAFREMHSGVQAKYRENLKSANGLEQYKKQQADYMKEYRDKRLAELKEKANQHFYPHGMIDITK